MSAISLWKDHSLTIVCWVSGTAGTALAWCFEDKVFDTVLGLSMGLITVALFYSLAGPLTEKNKPEKDPTP